MGDISDRAKINRARLAEVFNSPAESESVIWDEEEWWIRHEPWLKSRGYVLRPRFRPGWKPSWHTAKNPRALWGAEDRIHIGVSHGLHGARPRLIGVQYPFLLDATRTSDGAVVMFKRVDKTRHPKEVELTTMLSSPPFTSDPRNHCVPVYEVLQDPEDDKYQLMVLPLLRRYSDPRFDTVGEAVICFRQIIQVHHALAYSAKRISQFYSVSSSYTRIRSLIGQLHWKNYCGRF